MTIHAHVSIESADCDGRYSRSYVRMPDDWQSDSEFRAETFASVLMYANEFTKVEFTSDGFHHDEFTDEGFIHSEFTWCNDDDTDVKNTFRDHSAEAMGY